jgi:acyl-CoA synthetase (AMP-forming)/AMP-acid ligase II
MHPDHPDQPGQPGDHSNEARDDATAALLASLPQRLCAIPQRWAARTPHAPALHDGQRCWSYGELAAAVESCALTLRALDVRGGDRLLVVGENCVAQVVLLFAAARIDAWFSAVSGRLAARELDAIRDHAQPRRVLYTSASSAEAAAHGARHGARAGTTPTLGAWMVGPLQADCVPEPVHASGQYQAAALLYTTGTTGTTGQPKGVMLSHRSLLYIAAVSGALRGLTAADRVCGVLPISHVYGLTSVMLGTLHAGACLYLAPRFAAPALLAMLRDQRLTILQGVPAMYARLLELTGDAGAGPAAAASLRFLYAGGAPLDPALKQAVEQRFGLPLHNGYGMTECAPTISQTRLAAPRADTSVGHAIPGVTVQITGTDGVALAAGAVGELWLRGPNVMLGYYRAPALTAAALRAGGWLATGDLARQHDDGALFIVGRSKELIIRAGFKVYPLEVETLLNGHPGVRQSVVVGRAVAGGDEEVVAFVEPDGRRPADGDTLLAYLKPLLAGYKLPARIILMAALPAAASGKVLRGRLAALASNKLE